ncbi:MAG: Uma2 family endonuclease [Elainella sp.]
MVRESSVPSALTDWLPPEPPTDLIFDDGVPLESNRHRLAMNVLIRSMLVAYRERNDFFAGGNMFIYYSRTQRMNQDFRGPDFFVTLGVDASRERQGWVVWEEEGRYPDVIVELLSPSTESQDRGPKKEIYERIFKTRNYFIYDPFNPSSLQGWQLDQRQTYQSLMPDERGWLWSDVLGLWLGTWRGVLDREPPTGSCHWLRFYDAQGELVPLPEELAQREVEQAQQQAEQAQREAELAQQQVEQAQREAEQAQQEAEQERLRAERLAERLRQLGVDPEAD